MCLWGLPRVLEAHLALALTLGSGRQACCVSRVALLAPTQVLIDPDRSWRCAFVQARGHRTQRRQIQSPRRCLTSTDLPPIPGTPDVCQATHEARSSLPRHQEEMCKGHRAHTSPHPEACPGSPVLRTAPALPFALSGFCVSLHSPFENLAGIFFSSLAYSLQNPPLS